MIDELVTVLVDSLEKFKPIVKAVFMNVHPQVVRSRRANVEPKRCGPNVLLWTGTEADLGDVSHQIDQVA